LIVFFRDMRLLISAITAAALAIGASTFADAPGKPGINPIPCSDQAWQRVDPKFDPLTGAKAFHGEYDGGVYRIEIPDNWNGDLALYAHGYVPMTGANGLNLRAGNPPIREHLILGKPGEYTEKGRQLASVEIQISGGARPFAGEGLAQGNRFGGNINPGAIAGSTTLANRAVMTTHIRYAIDEGLGLSADTLNARARRKTFDAEIRNPMGPYEEIVPFDGQLARPLLTMHGTGDLFVPVFLEQALKRAVAASGKESLLAQRLYRIGGHCGFTEREMVKAFDDLATWVHEGARPEGDEVYGDLSDAALKFTDPLRPGDPGTRRIIAPANPGR
jgi:hypothetical protein